MSERLELKGFDILTQLNYREVTYQNGVER